MAIGTPLPPMVDRIGLAVDHMDQGRAQAQVVDISHVAADLVNVADVGSRVAPSRVLSTPSAVVKETRAGAIGAAVVAAHHQDRGEVVADVHRHGSAWRGRSWRDDRRS